MNLAIRNTTNAIIAKLIRSPMNCPTPQLKGPAVSMNVFSTPPGIAGEIVGMIMLSTSDLISVVAATPIMNAIASARTLYSFKNSLNSAINPTVFIIAI